MPADAVDPFNQKPQPVGLSPPKSATTQQRGPGGLTDAEFIHTRNIIGHVQRPALVAVLQSLMDDFPQLAPVIRVRCEKAMAYVMSQQQQAAQGFGGSTPPYDSVPTPPGSNRKSGSHNRSRRDEEQDTCGIHGTTRAVKHLNYNLATMRWECIPGFHCLVEGGRSGTPSSSTTPVVGTSPVKARRSSGAPLAPLTPPPADHDHDRHEGSSPQVDINSLETLLQSLRDREED